MAVGADSVFPLPPVAGVKIGSACAGIRYADRRDLVVFELCEGCSVAGTFTQNAFCAAPVTVCKQHLQAPDAIRYLVINTGNANAGTGERGMHDALATCEAVAQLTGCRADQVLPFSTGVIGEPLPVDRLISGLPAALADAAEDRWEQAARGIMTTDTRPKGVGVVMDIDGRPVTISGISKGAGMIKPNMATMLGFVATDAAIEAGLLQRMLSRVVHLSFNSITVDGDTSTNDACIAVASGASGVRIESEAAQTQFEAGLRQVCEQLAQAIVRDGEGATKFVTVAVTGGRDHDECRRVGYAVAESPLVKTALFASDPNWGRILAAVGYAGVPDLDVSGVTVALNNTVLATRGAVDAGYTEAAGQAAMAGEQISIQIDLGRGAHTATIWTTDLSYDYVRINADYRS